MPRTPRAAYLRLLEELFEVVFVSFFAPPMSSLRTAPTSSRFLPPSSRIFSSMRALGDQLVIRDHPGLSDAVCAIGRLVLDGGVPPWVEVDHGVGGGQV